jgi:hypothetical protein
VRILPQVGERLRVGHRRPPQALRDDLPRARAEGVLEEPARAGLDVPGGELRLDVAEGLLDAWHRLDAEQRRLVPDHAAHEIRPAARERQRDRRAVRGAQHVHGPEVQELDEPREVVLVAPARRRLRATLAACVASAVVRDDAV